jgi:hypothetical protein
MLVLLMREGYNIQKYNGLLLDDAHIKFQVNPSIIRKNKQRKATRHDAISLLFFVK